ncbi:ABC transporter substrate-binding protein [Halalkalibacter urbisdiaboli]|uniref:ABC transporter substrate-binding protein n=1 Tax=Halalkalibacter urbisdiaboli TaxID=1960589 RepID=UPI000B433D80|nr:ABC transporter substrate-binding protein [Halalkalibacter urbisdiaboli]
MKQLKMLAVILIMILMAACGATQENEETTVEKDQEQIADEVADSDTYPLTIEDALGEQVTIEAKPERIVSLIPSITETLYALGQGEFIVGRTNWDNYPEEVLEVESVGDMSFDVEKVLSLQPDLVLSHESGAHSSAEGLEQLRQAGITVLIINDAQKIDEVYESISTIGQATDSIEKAEDVIYEMKESIASIAEKASEIPEEERANVWIEVSPDLFTTGQGTFMDEMVTIINATNVAGSEQGWVQFSEEQVVALNPDVIITTYGGYEEEEPSVTIKQRDAWKDVSAVVNERIYDVDADMVTRSGPRLAKGVEQLAIAIYPEVFGE